MERGHQNQVIVGVSLILFPGCLKRSKSESPRVLADPVDEVLEAPKIFEQPTENLVGKQRAGEKIGSVGQTGLRSTVFVQGFQDLPGFLHVNPGCQHVEIFQDSASSIHLYQQSWWAVYALSFLAKAEVDRVESHVWSVGDRSGGRHNLLSLLKDSWKNCSE